MRILWVIFQPSNTLFIMTVLGTALWLTGWHTTAKWILAGTALVFAAIMLTPLASYLTVTLETRFPHPPLPARVDGIISLGGAVNTNTTERWGRPQLNDRIERLTEAATLSRRYPDATLLISGGHWNPKDKLSEADVARRLFNEIGLPIENAVFEDRSTTTWENALMSKELVKPQPRQTWLLVTSAYHMPRAVGVFRRLGWDVVPFPVDYYTDGAISGDTFSSIGFRLAAMDFIVREWAALAAYRLQDRTSTLFPG